MMMVSPKYRISQTATSAVCVMTCLMVAPNLKTMEIVRVSLFLIFLRTLPPIRFLLTMVMVLSFCIIAICVFQLLPVDTEEEFSCSMMEIAASSSGGKTRRRRRRSSGTRSLDVFDGIRNND